MARRVELECRGYCLDEQAFRGAIVAGRLCAFGQVSQCYSEQPSIADRADKLDARVAQLQGSGMVASVEGQYAQNNQSANPCARGGTWHRQYFCSETLGVGGVVERLKRSMMEPGRLVIPAEHPESVAVRLRAGACSAGGATNICPLVAP